VIRLIACDIDGTLLHGAQRDIDPAALREIGRLLDLGVRFCPASGRQYSSLRRLFAPVADRLTYLCENGAVLYGPGDPGPILGKVPMDRALALELAHAILDRPDCEVLISGANTSYLCPKAEDVVVHVRDFVGNNVALVPTPEGVEEDILKVSAYCLQGVGPVWPQLAPLGEGRCAAAVAGEKWVDFTCADKGVGLLRLCAALGIDPADTLAIGDNYNDLPMLEAAGRPYIMDNAAPDLRARFSRHCRRVEDILQTIPEREETNDDGCTV
jgi:hypothetical protein